MWAALGLSEGLIEGLTANGYVEPTAMQRKLIRAYLVGENVLAQAKSGSGKTLSFVVSLLQKVDLEFAHPDSLAVAPTHVSEEQQVNVPQRLQALVVVPTREIGVQVAAEFVKIAWHYIPLTELRVLACLGGCPMSYDLIGMRIQRPQIVVATPGRLLTLLQDQSSSTFKKARTHHPTVARAVHAMKWQLPPVKYLVLDEADRLLQENFKDQLLAIVSHIQQPTPIQVFACSATFSPPVLNLVEKIVYELVCCTAKKPAEESDTLNILVDGLDDETPCLIDRTPTILTDEPIKILRKHFFVSSLMNPQAESAAMIPPRMDLDQKVNYKPVERPLLEKVRCSVLPLSNDVADLVRAVPDEGVVSGIEGAAGAALTAPQALAALNRWLDEDWDHWPDLRPKFLALVWCLWRYAEERFIIFCNDSFSGKKIAQVLTLMGLETDFVSAKVEQTVRSRVLERFAAAPSRRGLVGSDLLARGIDVPAVNLVVSVDLPESKDTCLHRIGRAGRFEREGRAIFLLREADELRTLELFTFQTGLRVDQLFGQTEKSSLY